MHAVRKMFRNAIDKNVCFDYNNSRDGKEYGCTKYMRRFSKECILYYEF